MKRTYATFGSASGKRKREEVEEAKEVEADIDIIIFSAFAKSVDGNNKGAVFTLNGGDVVQGTPRTLSIGPGDGDALAVVCYGSRGSTMSDHHRCVPLVVSNPHEDSKVSKVIKVIGTHVPPTVKINYDEINKCVGPCYFAPDAIQSGLYRLPCLPRGLDPRFVARVAEAMQADIQFVRIVSCPAGYGAPIQHEDSCGPVCVTMIFGPDSTYRDIVVTI